MTVRGSALTQELEREETVRDLRDVIDARLPDEGLVVDGSPWRWRDLRS